MIGKIQSYSPNFKGNFTIGKNGSKEIAKKIVDIYDDDRKQQEVINELLDLKEYWNRNTPENDHGYIDISTFYGYTQELNIKIFHTRGKNVLCHEARSIDAYDMDHIKDRIKEDLKNKDCIEQMNQAIRANKNRDSKINSYVAMLDDSNNPPRPKRKISCHIAQN